MNELSSYILHKRAEFLWQVRNFFYSKNFLEIDTPKLKNTPGMEPYLDPFVVSSPHSSKEGYLVTSPEYSLKMALSYGLEKIFEIGHVYRSGEKGDLHTREFLMLEFYQTGIDEFALMDICIDLFEHLEKNFHSIGFFREKCKKISIKNLFLETIGISYSERELVTFLRENYSKTKNYDVMRYEDLFFLVFLNFIEPKLSNEVLFLYHYPAPLASLAKVENNVARRFEIYWDKIELGNAFYELNDKQAQLERFQEEQKLRKELGKEVFEIDWKFLDSLERLPNCAGIAMGLDRLFMIFMKEKSLRFVSPYWKSS
ncbi:MAG: elongation factor P--(R)-beta-lysine ligase [Leptospiraceae bacterium]|nr:elongation factor P--(R)-beta-lysine ligase [Leptospiraceae bacterium]